MTTTPAEFSKWLQEHLSKSTDPRTVDLIPAPCGCGKSFSMTVQIAEALKSGNDVGILLITDEVERMHNYLDGHGDSYLASYLDRNRDRILIYEARNARVDRHKLLKVPIVVMTTQRFFSLDRDEVIDLTNTHIPKRHIFIDEKAPISETIEIDLGTFNDIDTIISKRLDNTAQAKDWMLEQWRNLRSRYTKIMEEYEKSHTDNELKFWHTDNDRHATTDDERFLSLATKTYATKFRRADVDAIKKIKTIFQLVNDGGLYISKRKSNSRSTDEYANQFIIVLDHSDLLLDVGSKTVILDGTGGIDYIYDLWYVNKIECDKFKRDLSNLTINIIDVNSSKSNIAKHPSNNKQLRTIIDYAKTIPKVDVVFTYGYGNVENVDDDKTVERQFYNKGFTTSHFGAIKGTNAYRNCTDFLQVGLNRYKNEQYLAQAIFNIRNRHNPDKEWCSAVNVNTYAISIMNRGILADIEQNLYRGVIRNADNQKKETYTLLYRCKPKVDKNGIDHNDLSNLTTMIKDRYEPLGATINIIDEPPMFKKLKTQERQTSDGHKTAAQKVTEFLDVMEQRPGKPFKLADLLKECGLNRDEYKNALKRNAHIKMRLNSIRTDKQGWFMFPAATKNNA